MRLLKRLFKCLAAFFLVLLVFWTAVLGLLQTEHGQRWALGNFKGYLERNTPISFEVGLVHFSFPLSLELKNVDLSYETRPFASIDRLNICCAYSHLLNGRLVFSKLEASGIRIHRLPKGISSTDHAPETVWDASPLPFYVKAQAIAFHDIRLSPEAINHAAVRQEWKSLLASTTYQLQGTVTNNPFRRAISAHLQIKATSDNPQFPPANIGIAAHNQQLNLSCHINPLPLHLLHACFPAGVTGNLAAFASIKDVVWKRINQWSNHPGNVIDGYFKLILDAPKENHSLIALLIKEQTTLTSRYHLKSTGEIELTEFNAVNPSLQLEGGALIHAKNEILQAHVNGHVKDIDDLSSKLGQKISGPLAFSVGGEGPLLSPNLQLNFASNQLQIHEQAVSNIQATIHANPNTYGITGKVELSLDHQNQPWKLGTIFEWKDPTFTIAHLVMDGVNGTLKGDIACTLPECLLEGQLTAESRKLDDFSSYLPSPISGEGKLEILFTHFLDEHHEKVQKIAAACMLRNIDWQHVQARQLQFDMSLESSQKNEAMITVLSHLKGNGIRWEGYAVDHCLLTAEHLIERQDKFIKRTNGHWDAQGIQWAKGAIEQAEGNVDLANPSDSFQGSLQVSLRNVQASSLKFAELTGSTTIKPDTLSSPFFLKGKGSWKEALIFAAQGNWNYKDQEFTLLTEQLTGALGPYSLTLMQPLLVLQQADGLQMTGLHLRLGEGELKATFEQKKQTLAAQFQTNAFPSELFYFVAPNLPLSGRATFQGELKGNLEAPEGHFQVDLHNVQIVEEMFAQKPFLNGKVLVDLNASGISLQGDLTGIGRTPLFVSGSLPIHLSLKPYKLNVDKSQPVNFTLNAEGDLDPYLSLFFHDTKNLTGHSKIALKLYGQLQSPTIKGTIDLIDGSYESLNTGALYHHIQAHLEGDGSKIVLTEFSAQDNKNGSLTATGAVTIDPNNYFPFEFKIQPSQINILDSDYANISASGSLSLIGNSKKSKLQGELNVGQAIIRLEEALPKQIKSVDVTYVNLSEKQKLSQQDAQNHESASPIELDIKLVAENNVRITANHLKSEWKGVLAVNGTEDKIQLHGDLRVTNGEYDFNGKLFNITQGTIHFGGAPDKKTNIYVVASHELDRLRADIIVKGPANKPEISFRSNPPLAQREVLSYILFNRGISDITPDQGDQLSQSFISLSSNEQTKGSTDFLTRLRNNIGIDRLDFTTNDKENKDFGLQVGKYITQNVIVSVNQSMTSLSPVIAVEAKLKKNFKVQAESGVVQDAPVRMSLKWKKDY